MLSARGFEVVYRFHHLNDVYGIMDDINDVLHRLVSHGRFIQRGLIYGGGIYPLHGFTVFLQAKLVSCRLA